MNKKIILSLIILISFSFVVSAQNVSNVNVKSLSDAQIQQFVQEAESRGLTLDQAITLAESRGASPTQINDLRRRISELKSGKTQATGVSKGESALSTMLVGDPLSEKKVFKATEKNKKIFGYNLFNNENLTFEPSINIATPASYVIGIGDELLINVWGASQQTYQLLVGQNGAIQIMDLGPIYISGMSFENAKNQIKKRLTAIYSGMSGDNPNTWADVSLSSLRSIKINVIGEVNIPGTYNLPSTATAFNALYFSGGPNENGSFRNIKLIRDGKMLQIIDVYDFLINGNTKSNIQLRDQDILFIPTYDKKVEVTGKFKRNGYFELAGKETLSDLIRYAGNFSEGAYKHRISVTKFTDKEMKMADVEMSEFAIYIPDNGDIIKADSIVNRYLNRVSINGAVNHPGYYELTKDLTLSKLIQKAEGVKAEAYMFRGIIIREMDNRMTELIPFNVDSVLLNKIDYPLKKEDSIQISDVFEMQQEQFVNLIGEVQKPGRFAYSKNMTLKDLIYMAGGFNEAASQSFIEISRRNNYEQAATETANMVNIFTTSVSRDLKLNSKDEGFVLQPFDHIYIRQAPSYFAQKTVSINGEVLYPGSYSIKSKKEHISDLIQRAGGFTKFAHIEGATLKRAYDNEDINLDYMNISKDTLGVDSTIREKQADLLELNLNKILANPHSVYDYVLKEGDAINIPISTLEIRVFGEVMNPIGLAYEKGKPLKYYIDKTGGFSSEAKRNKVYVLYANKTTKTTQNNVLFNKYPPIEPGCQIVIPPKPERKQQDSSGKILAYASTIASLAIALTAILK